MMWVTLAWALWLAPTPPAPEGMARVGPGMLRLAYPAKGEPEAVPVEPFLLDRRPVSNADMLAFVSAETRWQRGRIPAIYVDEGYLSDWAAGDALGPPGDNNRPEQPVTRVSWFVAKAYCAWRGARLPTEREWELAAAADETRVDAAADPKFQARILEWYSRPTSGVLPAAGAGAPNAWGVSDLHGVVWEWVYDWSSTLVTGDNRDRGNVDKALFCGAGAIAARDVGDYATFMRFAFRSALGARFTTRNLGFRCARDLASPRQEVNR